MLDDFNTNSVKAKSKMLIIMLIKMSYLKFCFLSTMGTIAIFPIIAMNTTAIITI